MDVVCVNSVNAKTQGQVDVEGRRINRNKIWANNAAICCFEGPVCSAVIAGIEVGGAELAAKYVGKVETREEEGGCWDEGTYVHRYFVKSEGEQRIQIILKRFELDLIQSGPLRGLKWTRVSWTVTCIVTSSASQCK